MQALTTTLDGEDDLPGLMRAPGGALVVQPAAVLRRLAGTATESDRAADADADAAEVRRQAQAAVESEETVRLLEGLGLALPDAAPPRPVSRTVVDLQDAEQVRSEAERLLGDLLHVGHEPTWTRTTLHGRADALDPTAPGPTSGPFGSGPPDGTGSSGSSGASGSIEATGATGPSGPVRAARDRPGERDVTVDRATGRPQVDAAAAMTGDGYRFGAAQRRAVEQASPTCAAPGCTVPVERCDVDHVRAWGDGGPTASGNALPACRHHHLLKTHGGWTWRVHGDGAVELTTREGTVVRTPPADLLAAQRLAVLRDALARLGEDVVAGLGGPGPAEAGAPARDPGDGEVTADGARSDGGGAGSDGAGGARAADVPDGWAVVQARGDEAGDAHDDGPPPF